MPGNSDVQRSARSLQFLGNSAAAILPGLLLGIVVFTLGQLLVRAGVTRAAALREASARKVIVGALRSTPGILVDPVPDALVTGLGNSGVDMSARFWIDPPRRREAVDALDSAVEAVKNALTEAGIDLPFPTSQVLWHDQAEETDGDRVRQREGWPAAGRRVPRPRWQAALDTHSEGSQPQDAHKGDSP